MSRKTKSARQDTGIVEDKEQKYKKQAQDLRAKNRQLTRENARLRKELRKTDNLLEGSVEIIEVAPIQEVSESQEREQCSRCKKFSVDTIQAGIRDVLICKDCGYRTTRSSEDATQV